jgi:GT2 family glycosyltransferase
MISIVIPTYLNAKGLQDCLASIRKFTTGDYEVIVVANGAPEETRPFATLWYDKPLGFAKAVNAGLCVAKGDYVLILNDDCVFLSQWVDTMLAPFSDPKMGIVGVKEHTEVGIRFLIGFCLLVRMSVLDKVGLLDEQFNVGGMEDVDLCHRIRLAGYGLKQVNVNMTHVPETTVHNLPEGRQHWEKTFRKNKDLLAVKWNLRRRVTVDICTRNRYTTSLPMCLAAVASQTYKPEQVIIYDDSDPLDDMREDPVLMGLFTILQRKGIQWRVIFGNGRGQVTGHRIAIAEAKGDFIWRVDDDNIPEPDCLEKLMSQMDPDVGAVGGLVLDVNNGNDQSTLASSKIEDIYLGLNVQWYRSTKSCEVDHLYSTFVYRKGKDYYPGNLSRIGHREETIMSHRMKMDGWRLLVNAEAVTWHLRLSTGGIRDGYQEMWQHDENIFTGLMAEWGVKAKRYKAITLDNGIGDHYAFKSVLPEIRAKHPDIIVAACYPAVLGDCGLKLISIGEARSLGWADNVYKFMAETHWKKGLTDAFKAYYC